jgi:hypothetical protein
MRGGRSVRPHGTPWHWNQCRSPHRFGRVDVSRKKIFREGGVDGLLKARYRRLWPIESAKGRVDVERPTGRGVGPGIGPKSWMGTGLAWRECMGIEPTGDRFHGRPPVLKTGARTSSTSTPRGRTMIVARPVAVGQPGSRLLSDASSVPRTPNGSEIVFATRTPRNPKRSTRPNRQAMARAVIPSHGRPRASPTAVPRRVPTEAIRLSRRRKGRRHGAGSEVGRAVSRTTHLQCVPGHFTMGRVS